MKEPEAFVCLGAKNGEARDAEPDEWSQGNPSREVRTALHKTLFPFQEVSTSLCVYEGIGVPCASDSHRSRMYQAHVEVQSCDALVKELELLIRSACRWSDSLGDHSRETRLTSESANHVTLLREYK